jgi:glycosyltransferase involved in cell wall biosynthesis
MTESPVSAQPPLLSVVLSFKNEAGNIPELLARLRATLGAEREKGHLRGHELVFVNDASTDQSEAILTAEAAKGDIVLINMSRVFGVSPCVMAGIRQAAGDLVVYMDSDLQDPPELIAEMLRLWREDPGLDVVNTVRLSRAGESKAKLFLTGIGYMILQKTSDIPLMREAGDFKLMSRRVVDHLVTMREVLPFMRGLVNWIGYKQVALPYHREARAQGVSQFNVLGWRVIRNFLFSALISFSSAPLVFSLILGGVAVLIAFGVILYALGLYIFYDQVTSGWTSIIISVMFMGGVQLISNGINGLYINSIFLETKGRPPYIVRSVVGPAKS